MCTNALISARAVALEEAKLDHLLHAKRANHSVQTSDPDRLVTLTLTGGSLPPAKSCSAASLSGDANIYRMRTRRTPEVDDEEG